jgi:hypothetical protein
MHQGSVGPVGIARCKGTNNLAIGLVALTVDKLAIDAHAINLLQRHLKVVQILF